MATLESKDALPVCLAAARLRDRPLDMYALACVRLEQAGLAREGDAVWKAAYRYAFRLMEVESGLSLRASNPNYRPRPSRTLTDEENALVREVAEAALAEWRPICEALGGAMPWAPLTVPEVEKALSLIADRDGQREAEYRRALASPRARHSSLADRLAAAQR